MFAELSALLAAGALRVPIEAVYPLHEIAAALEHAQRPQRSGKVLLQCASDIA
jgi:NADPH:quinone reductase-like Zn-dependent oxidoreductase